MEVTKAGVEELETVLVPISVTIALKGTKGCVCVDWQLDPELLKATGSRSFIKIASPVAAELGGLIDPKHVYNVGLVMHDRANKTFPTYVESVTRQQGGLLLKASAAIAELRGTVGYAANVTEVIEPTPSVGKSPRLVVYFNSTGTDTNSVLRINIKFSVRVSGSKTPDFD